RVQAEPDLLWLALAEEGQAHLEIAIHLNIQGEEFREALHIWRADVVLKSIDIRIRQARVNIDHGTDPHGTGQREESPAYDPIAHILRQIADSIGTDHGVLKRHKYG